MLQAKVLFLENLAVYEIMWKNIVTDDKIVSKLLPLQFMFTILKNPVLSTSAFIYRTKELLKFSYWYTELQIGTLSKPHNYIHTPIYTLLNNAG
jgi:hypothetical protein